MLVSIVTFESAFSTGGKILDQYRSSLTPKIIEALIYAQNWFRSKSLSLDVEEHMEELSKLELSNSLYFFFVFDIIFYTLYFERLLNMFMSFFYYYIFQFEIYRCLPNCWTYNNWSKFNNKVTIS